MMTLEEVWENLRRDPETKATMEEVDRLYKTFKKMENLIVADLEAKLEESESKAKTYAKEIVFLDNKLENLNKEFELAQEHIEKTVEYWQNKCSQLKQQLAEKDKIIKHYKNWLDELRFRERNINGLIEQLPNQNQTAIEELEKVKKLLVEKMKLATDKLDCAYYIDQQIKSIKGEIE